jgi:hypothetical protein
MIFRMRRRPQSIAVASLTVVLALASCTGHEPAASPPVSPAPPASPAEPDPAQWRTDFDRLAEGVRLADFIQAARGRDAIPALDRPSVVPVASVDWIGADEPVIALGMDGEWRAYPLQIMLWHEIVNDDLAGIPVTVTFCPLCHTSVAFDRRLGGDVLDFGVTGYLRRSDLVMYDRQTETWWQQATGIGLAGLHAGSHLTILPSSVIAWSDFTDAHPDATVLDRATGFDRPYGRNPYPGWDRTARNPFFGPAQLEPCDGAPGCLDPKERVGVVSEGGTTTVYPFRDVAAAGGLVVDELGTTPVVVWWLPDVTTVLDSELIEHGDQVGTLVAFERRLDGLTLSFEVRDGALHDRETGSGWNSLGLATSGPSAGSQLMPLQLDTPYWFGFAAFGAGYEIWTAHDVDDG